MYDTDSEKIKFHFLQCAHNTQVFDITYVNQTNENPKNKEIKNLGLPPGTQGIGFGRIKGKEIEPQAIFILPTKTIQVREQVSRPLIAHLCKSDEGIKLLKQLDIIAETPAWASYHKKALETFGEKENIEIDESAQIEIKNHGAYVPAWLFIPNEEPIEIK